VPLAACVQRITFVDKTTKYIFYVKVSIPDKTSKKIGCSGNVSWGSKNYFRLIIYSKSSINPENLAKIGPVDYEIINLTEIAKNKKKQKQNI